MEFKLHPFNSLGRYKYADIIALHQKQWIFSRHKARTTWETQGGHIEPGETPLEAAKRELFEETGATAFDIFPVCDYALTGWFNGRDVAGNSQVFYAQVHTLGAIPPHSEIGEIRLFDSPPGALTYPGFLEAMKDYITPVGCFLTYITRPTGLERTE